MRDFSYDPNLTVKPNTDSLMLSKGRNNNFIKDSSNQFNLTNYFVIRTIAYQHRRDVF